MERRLLLFIVLSFAILWLHVMFFTPKRPPKKAPGVAAQKEAEEQGNEGRENGKQKPPKAEAAEEPRDEAEVAAVVETPETPPRWVTLGSADPEAGYRMLVTLTNKGGAVARIELNSHKYHDLDDRSGYLGNLVMDESAIDEALQGKGCPVQIVGPGTPAEKAGLRPGDLIKTLDGREIAGTEDFAAALEETRPGREITLTVIRKNKENEDEEKTLTATTERRPLELIRPDGSDPLSFLFTLDQYGDRKLADQRKRDACLARLFDDLNVREPVLRELDLSDLNMSEGEIRVPRKGKEQWTELTEAPRQALNAWLAVRGKKAGPLFPSSPGDIERRLPVERIEAIVEQLRDRGQGSRDAPLFVELDGLDLRTGNWEIVASGRDTAVFRRVLPKFGLEITKTYRLAEVPRDQQGNANYPAYHLMFDVKVRNTGKRKHQVAYQLDGPTGLPDEGAWYANKVSRNWGKAGLRDVVVSLDRQTPKLITCSKIANNKVEDLPWQDQSVTYIGVDAQYFSAVMIPEKEDPAEIWFAESWPIRVGPVEEKMPEKTDTSCRLISRTRELEPGDEMGCRFTVFTGPKQPKLLAHYRLGELVYYGWFGFLAEPLSHILHAFYMVVRNYGLAIILLTVLVRGCMFPLSRKQVLGALKMQELQPELKKIQEKYKKDMEGRTKAQQELFRKHNYNPLSGCLVLFIQLPIFIALYRSLMVDIELRQAPLISQSIRWCSNLAAPDMFFDWSGFMPEFVTRGIGLFGLGPYFNILPIATVALFLGQQKMLMPPPADDQARMQQNIMKYMMIFMGVLFFKVASGLCVYFIASSLWGLGERRFLPKREDQEEITQPREKPKPKSKPKPKPAPTRSGANGDGAPTRKKKKRKRSRGK